VLVHNISVAVLSIFLMVRIGFWWNFWKSLSCIMIVLSGNVSCSSVVIFDNSIFRYF
jgi:hypothetical protein